MKRSFVCILCILSLVCGCVNEKRSAPVEGRIAVSSELNPIIARSKSKNTIKLTSGQNVSLWSQSGATGQNLTPHTLASDNIKQIWATNIGEGLSSDRWTMAQPIVANGIIYALDADFKLSAVRLKDGKKFWSSRLPIKNPTSIKTVGIAYSYDKLFAVSGNGTVVCIDLNGNVIWNKDLKLAIRSTPTIYRNKIYLLSADNQLVLLNTTNGSELWRYKGMPVDTNLLGMGTPAMYKKYAVVPFSNGEIITFNTSDESIIWTDYLSAPRSFNRITDLTHILASPVIENEIVYLIGNAGKMGAYKLSSGVPIWTLPVGGNNTPVISGNTLFMINTQNILMAVDKETGKLFWNTALTSKTTEKEATWKGPLLVGDKAIVVSSQGDIVFIQAKTGKEKHRIETDGIAVAPINVDGTILFLTNEADLLAYR